MNRKFLVLQIIALILLVSGCKNKHFISDKSYRNKVEEQFRIQKTLAAGRSEKLFGVFDRDLSREEKEALTFLYAFMSLNDLADYDGDFYLRNVRSSLAARDIFSWGKAIPEKLFRHFVLPLRVNNENLDSSRQYCFAELKDRIKHLPMKDAFLEVNHWCHEKVTYLGTDDRTSSPLATIKTAYGRCGEESTFTVAALRAVCIPARQCYTPRWAHTDDNHAWVEAWVDGQWHYIGACEPDAGLDMAWFTGPVKRAMLVSTNVFGDYDGPEDVLVKNTRYTRINILPDYAITRRIYVKVKDRNSKLADDATVEFQLYNYAEFYPLASALTGKNGVCSFLTGLGDLLVWAAKDNQFGYSKVTVKNSDTVTIVLSHSPGEEYSREFDLVPPPELKTEVKVNDSLHKRNSERLAFEDKIRADYEITFIDSSKCHRLAVKLKINSDTLWNYIHKSRGNWRELIAFISSVPEERKQWIFPLLESLSAKDLRDINPDVLDDQLRFTIRPGSPVQNNLFATCILSPRVDNELLKPFKALFQQKFEKSFIENSRSDPGIVVHWVKDNIRIDNDANYSRAPLTPVGVFEMKTADTHSRDIFFVALCRSFGIASRLEPASKITQYYRNNQWEDVRFEKIQPASVLKGTLTLSTDKANDRLPEYYTHFTVEKFTNGFYRSLDFENDPVMKKFPATIELSPGPCLIVTGSRLPDGTVLARLDFVNVEARKTTNENLILRKQSLSAPVYGKISQLAAFLRIMDIAEKPGIFSKGLILAWIDPGNEPSRHLVADLARIKEDFEKWKGCVNIMFKNEQEKDQFISVNAREMPLNSGYGIYKKEHLDAIGKLTGKVPGTNLPLVIFISPDGVINYFSEGYRIGICDDLMAFTRK